MKRVLLTGGTGNLGKEVASRLLHKNFDISILSSNAGAGTISGTTIVHGNLTTGQGLTNATSGIDTIIHCASNPRNSQEVDVQGTSNLLQTIDRQRTNHLVYISIVGVNKSDYPYYRAKFEVERMIAESGIPYTILRATQFHSFVFQLLLNFLKDNDGQVITVPSGMKFQSVDIKEVASKMVEHLEAPSGLLPDYGGPQILDFEIMVQQYLEMTRSPHTIRAANLAGERFELFRSGINLCPEHKSGQLTWQQFLEDTKSS